MTPPNAPTAAAKAPCETCKSTDWHNLIDGRCWPYCGHTAPIAAERAGEELMPRELRSFYAGEARRSPEMTVVPVKEWMDAVRRYEATVVAFEFALRSAFEKRDAARRENETGAIPLSADEIDALRYCVKKAEHCVRMHATSATYAAVMDTLARAYDVLARAALAAAHGEDHAE